MPEVASAFVSILPSAKGFGKSLDKQVGGDLGKSGKRMGASFGKVFAAAAAIGIGAKAFGFLSGSLAEAREAAVVGARTDNVIKKMGASAWTSSKQVGALASSLSRKAGIDDEAIQSGQNLLLTFGKVTNAAGKGNDIFDQTSSLMVDMSVAMGQDMKSSAIQLGKALNDPVKGVSALSRVGVSFTAQQKEQIKTLAESGNVLDAQKIILGEVKKQFGGAAKAMTTPAQKAAVAWGNFKESFGTLLLPVVDRVLGRMTPLINQMGAKLPQAMHAVKAAVTPVANILGQVLGPVIERVTEFARKNPAVMKAFAIGLGVVTAAVTVLTIATAAFSAALNSTGIPLVIIGLAALVAGLILAYQRSETFRGVVQKVGEQLRIFGGWLRTVVLPAVAALAQKVATSLHPILVALGDVLQNRVVPLVRRAAAKFTEWWPTIQRVIAVTARLYGKYVEFVALVAGKVLPVVIRFAGWLLSKMIPAIAAVIGTQIKAIGALVRFGAAVIGAGKKVVAFARTVSQKVGDVIAYFVHLPARITAALGDMKSLLVDAGRDIVGGLISGIDKKVGELKSKLGSITKLIPKHKGPPKKDRKLLNAAGVLIMQGLIDGLRFGEKGLEKTLKRVTDRIATFLQKGFIGKNLAKQMRGIVGKVAAETTKLSNLVAARKQMAGDVAGNLRGEFDLSTITATNEFGFSPSAGTAVKAAQAIVARMKAFATKIAALVKRGMPAGLIQEIAGMGSLEGGRVADIFLKASKADVGGLSKAFGDVGTFAQSVGNIVAGQQYNSQIGKQKDVVHGLRHEIREAFKDMKIDIDVGRGAAAHIVAVGTYQHKKRK